MAITKRDGITYYKYTCSFCGHDLLAKKGEKETLTYCPYCKSSSPWLIKPPTERILFELQEKYLSKIDDEAFEAYTLEIKKLKSEQNLKTIQEHEKNMDQKILGEMYQIVSSYVGSLLKQFIKKKAFFLAHEEFLDKVNEITFRWYTQFTKKPGFKIKDSWAGQLKWKIIEVLYDDSYVQEGQTLSLDYVENSFENNQTFLEKEGISIHSLFHKTEDPYDITIQLSEELRKVLKEIILVFKKEISKQDMILSLLAFLFFIKNEKRKEYLIYNFYGNSIRNNNENIKRLFRKYLRGINA